jgi:hypothetical protein
MAMSGWRLSLLVLLMMLAVMPVLQVSAATYSLIPPNRPAICSGAQGTWSGSTYVCNWGQPLSVASGDSITSNTNIRILSYSGFNLTNVTLGGTGYSIDLEAQGGNETRLTGSVLYGSIYGQSNNVRLQSGTVVHGQVSVTGNFQSNNASIAGNVSANNGITAVDTTFYANLTSSNSSIHLTRGVVHNNVTVTAQTLTATGTIFNGNILSTNGNITLTDASVAGNVSAPSNAITASNTDIGGTLSANGNVVLTDVNVTGTVTSSSNTVSSTGTTFGNGISAHSGILVTGGSITGNLTSGCNNIILNSTTMTSGTIQTTPTLGQGCAADRVEFNNSTINANLVGGPNNVNVNDSVFTGNIQARYNVNLNNSTVHGHIFGEINYDLHKATLTNSHVYGSVEVGQEPWQVIEGNWPSSAIYGDCTYGEVYPLPLCQEAEEPDPDPVVHHYELNYSAQGLTCESSAVTVKACANADCSELYSDNVNLTLEANNGAIWQGGSQISFSGGSSSTRLSKTSSGSTVLSVTGSGNPAFTCKADNQLTSACSISFQDTALRFSTIGNQYAGQTSPDKVKLQVIRTDNNTGACVARVTPASDVKFAYQCINPASCSSGQSFLIDDEPIAANPQTAVSQYSSLGRTFNNDAETEFSVVYSDVGTIKLYAQLALAATSEQPAVSLQAVSNEFVVRPYSLVIVSAFADSILNPGTTDDEEGFIAAGENFSLVVESRNQQGNATPNFGKENPREVVTAAFGSLLYPTHTGRSDGALSAGSTNLTLAANNGRQQVDHVSWSEVGTVKLRVASLNYQGAGDAISRPESGPIGRFYPSHFMLASSTLANSCTGFSYMAQPALTLNYRVLAKGVAGNTLVNYHAQDPLSPDYQGTATLSLQAAPVDPQTDNRFIVQQGAWLQGVYQVEQSDAIFNYPSSLQADGPYPQLQALLLITAEKDNRQFRFLNPDTQQTESTDSMLLDGSLNMRYGRLVLKGGNVAEPEPEPEPESGLVIYTEVPVEIRAEYWNGTGFTLNELDNCTQIHPNKLELENGLQVSGDPHSLLNGLSQALVVLVPAGQTGIWPISYNADDWLKYHWSGTTGRVNPSSEISIGRYRGNKRQIFWQEKLQ